MAGKMLTREQILARKTGRGTVTLSDGGTVSIKALTRNEALQVRAAESIREGDNLLISFGMVEPTMRPEDVDAWGDNDAAGDLVRVSNEISALSNMATTSGKESTKSPTQ